MQVLEPLVVTCVKTIFPEHPQFTFSHFFGFLQLGGIELDYIILLLLAVKAKVVLLHHLVGLRLTTTLGGLLVLVILLGTTLLLVCTVLLGNFILHDVDGAAFKFLSYLFLFALPCIFYTLTAIPFVLTNNLVFGSAYLGHKLQIKQSVVKDFKVLKLFGYWFFNLNFKLLVGPNLLFFYEI